MALAQEVRTSYAASRPAGRRTTAVGAEWLWPLLVVLATLLLAEVPHLLAGAERVRGTSPSTLSWGAQDVPRYLAEMHQVAARPAWQPSAPSVTQIPLAARNVPVFYLVLGKLAGALGAPAEIVYHLAEVAARALLISAIYLLATEVLPTVVQRRLALMLALFSSGLGALAGLPLQALGVRPLLNSPEFSQPELNTFLVLFTPPHLIVGLALLMLAAWCYLRAWRQAGRRWAILAGLTVLVLATVSPTSLATICLGLALHLAYCWHTERRLPGPAWHAARWMLLAALVFLSLTFLLLGMDRLWQQVLSETGARPSPSIPELLLSVAPLLLLALIGLPTLLARRGTAAALPLAWIAACVVLMYLPVGPQRRFAFGLAPLLALTAAPGLEDAWGWLRRTRSLNLRLERGFLMFALVEVLFASNFLLYGIIVSAAAHPGPPLFDQPAAITRSVERSNDLP